MKALLKIITGFFLSLRTSLWLMGLMLVLLFAGAFIMPGSQEFQGLHSTPLFKWIPEQPLSITWWLWGLIGVLTVMAVNTLFCSIESIVKKSNVTKWLLLISPQIIHAGALFILLAHLLSGMGASQKLAAAGEGSAIDLSGTDTVMKVKDIDIDLDYYGYITGWKVDVEYMSGGKVFRYDTISPNDPSVYTGFNINVKDLRAHPRKVVLLQINRDPGALWALAGGIMFIAGTFLLIALKIRAEK
jgi:hypothetical protein